jgi:DNA-binding GntR family transcriptional regulator
MTAADKAYAVLRDEIITCALEPGQQVAQPGLAARYQLGMTPLREALQRLALEGLVQPIPRFGYIVSPITLTDVNEIYELRLLLELPASRLATLRGTNEQIERIAQMADFRYIYRDSQSYSEFLTRNLAFHSAIAACSGNRRLEDTVCRLLDQMTRIFHLGLNLKDSAEEMRAEHQELASALRARNADLVEQITLSQIMRSRERVMEALVGGSELDLPKSLSQAVHFKPTTS